ncbi:hypothetical protein CTA2_5727 [Colletotrichum tanaceti]|uniref:Uncharacterized protein n=1 Tax=Colletotrichum tanaceti TaxID=1306861 RepID=A0A4U6XFN4_9PEZI|nr:hypothetical protein CTA2_5727 [Colletotrichum tanaceti]TKW54555.1 hypothetical protein CTA1_2296 [Colletotrichum tanaceti]
MDPLTPDQNKSITLSFPRLRRRRITCEYWTSLRIVAIVSGSVYVGPIVCRNEQFLYGSSKSEAYLRPRCWEHLTYERLAVHLYQLEIRPELVKQLYVEVKAIRAQFDGRLSPGVLQELKILDSLMKDDDDDDIIIIYDIIIIIISVMKEAQNVNPSTTSHFHRYVEKNITLKGGTFIPNRIKVEAIFAPLSSAF